MRCKANIVSRIRGCETISRQLWLQPLPRTNRSFSKVATRHGRSYGARSTTPKFSTKWSTTVPHLRRPSRHQSTSAATAAAASSIPNDPPMSAPKVLINDMENQEILISFTDDQAVRYPSFWLRDHCLCNSCSHPDTQQRQLDTFTLNPSIKASSIEPSSSGLQITWSDPTQHTSHYPWTWLSIHSPFPTPNTLTRHERKRQWIHVPPSASSSKYPSTPYNEIMTTDTGLRDFISQIHTYGLTFIPETPPTPEATEALLTRLALIRPTHYGGFWDFTSEPNPIDTAYTNLGLPAHTDTTYFTDPAGLQLFHCLAHTDPSGKLPGKGGESTFIDGFAAASKLYSLSRQLYESLSTVPVVFTASGAPEIGPFNNSTLAANGNPVLMHSGSLNPKNLSQIRWNNCDRSPLTTFPSHAAMRRWYEAAKTWSAILESPEFEIEVKLAPGMPVIFDNWRVLHGRRGFEGKRRICGAYIGMDDFRARGRRLGLTM